MVQPILFPILFPILVGAERPRKASADALKRAFSQAQPGDSVAAWPLRDRDTDENGTLWWTP